MLISEDEGRFGHAIFYLDKEFIVIGGDENTYKNFMLKKEKAR